MAALGTVTCDLDRTIKIVAIGGQTRDAENARPGHTYMNKQNRGALLDRVVKAAEASLAARNYVSPVDVLVGIGWLDPGTLERWRRGQVDCLERVVQANLPRISEAMKLFRVWAAGKGLSPSETQYVARSPGAADSAV